MKRDSLLALGLAATAVLMGGFSVAATVQYDPIELGYSNVDREPANDTLISAQGFLLEGRGSGMKPGRLVRAAPDADIVWKYNGSSERQWFYDVEQHNSTHLLLTTRRDGVSHAQLLTTQGDLVWEQSFEAKDTHDIDLVNSSTLAVAPMQKDYYEEGQRSFEDSLFLYNRSSDQKIWEWKFREHYQEPESFPRTGWTHLNDIEVMDNGLVMASPRNFDRVIFVNRSSGEVEETIGEQGNHSILNRQHNPDVIEWNEENKTVIVADSENDRIVEYTREDGEWKLSWELYGSFNWPRDADRLPNGNTLVSDTLNHRVVEVTPNGTVVWEFYAPWATYDAERMGTPEGSQGPSMAEQGYEGSFQVEGGSLSASAKVGKSHVCGDDKKIALPVQTSTQIRETCEGTPLEPVSEPVAEAYEKYVPWIKPDWMAPATLFSLPVSVLLLLVSVLSLYPGRLEFPEL